MDDKEHARFVALCGMMTSHHDGEVLTAARMANKFLADRKLTWADVLASGGACREEPRAERRHREQAEHQRMAQEALYSAHYVPSQRERTFLEQMLTWRQPTEKQMEWLRSIYERATEPPPQRYRHAG
jgi:DNA-binding transcriptional regulator LsrR (DeoR family)